ncbi:hypothetical protein FOA52_008767 [Chlamydomonas sp. UWO 241]|nr:hypothetical protein FOA52_008767 [Chlamydomonas sp. UWO 241]
MPACSSELKMQAPVDAVVRARVPGWLLLVDTSMMAAIAVWAVWATVYTHCTLDAHALCLASVAAVALSLSPRFPLEARCLIPGACGVVALFPVFCAELAWSRLATGEFELSPKPVLAEYLAEGGNKLVVVSLFATAYKAGAPAFSAPSVDAAAHSRGETAVARAAHHRRSTAVNTNTAEPAAPPTTTAAFDSAQMQYNSVDIARSVPFAAKFPSWHLADHLHLATPEGVEALRARVERTLSQRASQLTGAPVTLELVTLTVASGCIVVHGRVRMEGGVGDEAEFELIRSVLASELLLALTTDGDPVLDGDTASVQLGDGATPMELSFVAAGGRFVESPARLARPVAPPSAVPLLSASWPLLTLPREGSSLLQLQLCTARLARELGNDPELVVSWAPSGAPAAPMPLLRACVDHLQAAARARGNPPGLIDIGVDLGPRPSHGVIVAQLADGDALLATHSLAVLPASAQPVVSELLRARLPEDTLCSVAHDLGLLMCGPRARTPDEALAKRNVVLALMASESASRPALPALRALLGGLMLDLDAVDAKGGSPQRSSSSSHVATATATGAVAGRPPLLWCWVSTIVSATKAVHFAIDGSRAGAMAMCLHGLPYALALPAAAAARAWLVACLPRALRTVDGRAALRVYTTTVVLSTMGATGDCAIWAVSFKYGGDFLILLVWAAVERPRSPALGAAISLLAELPTMCAYRWYSLATCGQSMSFQVIITLVAKGTAMAKGIALLEPALPIIIAVNEYLLKVFGPAHKFIPQPTHVMLVAVLLAIIMHSGR